MGKIGVGIGDDFPVEDGKPKPSGESETEAAADPEFDKQRDEYRKARDAYREQRRKMRDAWRARRHAFRADMHARYGDAYDDRHDHHWDWSDRSHGYGPHRILHIVLILGLIMLGIAIFSHIYILFGLVVLAGLYYAYRGGFDHFDFRDPPHSATPPASPPGVAT